jgi:hypothetical protein
VTKKKDDGLIDPGNVTSKYLAELIALTPQAVSQLATRRVIRTNGRRGKYDISHAVPAYIGSIRGSGKADADARLKVQQERKLRLANDKEAATLVKIDDAAEAYRQGCLAWRAGANATPRRLATLLANANDAAEIQRILNDEFNDLFATMEKPLRDYFANAGVAFEVVPAGDASPSAPAKKNARPMGRRKKGTTVGKRGTGKVAK